MPTARKCGASVTQARANGAWPMDPLQFAVGHSQTRSPLQPMRIDAIPIGLNPPEDVNVIVEVPIGGEPIKYEMDKAAGTLVVDRFLHTPMRYPGNYGFVPHTLSEDG